MLIVDSLLEKATRSHQARSVCRCEFDRLPSYNSESEFLRETLSGLAHIGELFSCDSTRNEIVAAKIDEMSFE